MRRVTDRQALILRAIAKSVRERGYAPTLRELMAALSIRSTNGISDHLRALEKKDLVVVGWGTARALSLTEKARIYLAEHSNDAIPAIPEAIEMASAQSKELGRLNAEISTLRKELDDLRAVAKGNDAKLARVRTLMRDAFDRKTRAHEFYRLVREANDALFS